MSAPAHITVEEVEVSPKLASYWLELNTRNRAVTQSRVDAYAGIMSRGAWAPVTTFLFDRDNIMLDGQHRCLAIVKSGVTIKAAVRRGFDPEVFTSIDVDGSPRSAGDVLGIGGYANARLVATVARIVLRWESTGMPVVSGGGAIVFDQIEDIIRRYPGVATVEPLHNVPNVSVGLSTALRYLFSLADEELSQEFWHGMKTGLALVEGDPVYALRARFLRELSSDRKMLMRAHSGIIVRAWNAKVRGESVTRAVAPGPDDRFPPILGLSRNGDTQ